MRDLTKENRRESWHQAKEAFFHRFGIVTNRNLTEYPVNMNRRSRRKIIKSWARKLQHGEQLPQ